MDTIYERYRDMKEGIRGLFVETYSHVLGMTGKQVDTFTRCLQLGNPMIGIIPDAEGKPDGFSIEDREENKAFEVIIKNYM